MSANIGALLKKRFHIYKRDIAGIACEVFVPFIMVLIGCSITKISVITQSPPRTITPYAYSPWQPIIMNKDNVINSGEYDISPEVLFENLPGA